MFLFETRLDFGHVISAQKLVSQVPYVASYVEHSQSESRFSRSSEPLLVQTYVAYPILVLWRVGYVTKMKPNLSFLEHTGPHSATVRRANATKVLCCSLWHQCFKVLGISQKRTSIFTSFFAFFFLFCSPPPSPSS